MLTDFCPNKFGIVNSFIKTERYACTRGCSRCWNRTEKELQRDKEIWLDYEQTDFSKVDHDKWLKKWKLD